MSAIIFDLDGTLVDTPNAIAEITERILHEMGKPTDEAEIRKLVGKPLDRNFAQLLRVPLDHAEVAEAIGSYKKQFGKHVMETGANLLYPGVAEGLKMLRERGFVLAIATSKVYEAAVKTLAATGLTELFDAVAGHDSVEHGKPAPDLALFAAKQLGADPAECITVGDAVTDIEMSRAAGMPAIGVDYGVASAAELEAAGANPVVANFDALVVVLCSTGAAARG